MGTVQFEFVASGQGDVASAFKSVSSAAAAAAKNIAKYNDAAEHVRPPPDLGSGMGPYRSPPRRALPAAPDATPPKEANDATPEKRVPREAKAAKDVAKIWGISIDSIRAKIAGISLHALHKGFDAVSGTIGSAARESLKLQEISNRVSINARGAGQEAVDPNQLRREFENTAMATPGIKSEDIGLAAQAYVDLTGDLKAARDNMANFATVASASGANIKDVALAAASLGKNFDVKSAKDMQGVMANLAFAGKGNAVTLKDMAAQFQKLAAAGSAFDIGKGPEAVAKLGGLLQIARGGTKSAASAATAVENVFGGLTTKGAILKKEGVHVYDKHGKKRDIQDIIADTISKAGGQGGGNFEKKNEVLAKVFGKQGMRGLNPLVSAYQSAYNGKVGTSDQKQDAGIQAIHAAFIQASQATSDWSEIQKDAAQAQQDSSAKIEAAWENVKSKVGDALLPVIGELADRLGGTTGALDPFIEATALAASGLVGFLDMLKRFGLIAGGDKSHQQKSDDAQKKLDRVNEKLGAKGLSTMSATEKDYAKIGTSRSEVRALEATVRDEGAAAVDNGKVPQKLTQEEFAKQYAALNPGMAADDVKPLAAALTANPNDKTGSNDYAQKLFGENEKQSDLRHRYQEQVTSDKTGGSSAADDALAKVAAAAANAATALANIKVPDGSTGHISPGQ